MGKKNERDSSIELLRIFSIFIIILNHYALYSGFAFENNIELSNMIPKWLHIGGKLGVDIFIFISGYFLCEGNRFKAKKLVKLILEVFFYALVLIICGLIMKNLSYIHAIKLIFAIPAGYWEFITLYVMLYILSPYINIMLNHIQLKSFIKLMIILTFFWVIFPSFLKFEFGITYSILWFIYIYLLASFIKRIEKNIPNNPKLFIISGFMIILIIALSEIFIQFVAVNYLHRLNTAVEHFRKYNSIFIIMSMVSLFLGFKQLQIKSNIIINKLASTSLAVFIMHDNNVLRDWLWNEIFKSATFQYSKLLILHAVGSCMLIFICFAAIDLIRQKFIEKPVMKFLTPKVEYMEEMFNNKVDILSQKLE